jgi:DNA-binding MarR family transcriptional regulator
MNVLPETNITAEIEAVASGRVQAQDQVFVLLRSVQRELRQHYVRLARDHGLPFPLAGPGLGLLRVISEHPGVTLNEVARVTGLPKSRVSVLMSGLAAQGIVRKDSDSHDSRLVRLYVTPEGCGHIAEWAALAQQAMSYLLQPLSDEELAIVSEGLATLQRAFELAKKPASAGESVANGQLC